MCMYMYTYMYLFTVDSHLIHTVVASAGGLITARATKAEATAESNAREMPPVAH